jgi:hypothetical protein
MIDDPRGYPPTQRRWEEDDRYPYKDPWTVIDEHIRRLVRDHGRG